ncbi:hypothetical protein NC653_000030 [Populus alba x Populus x berolinensis]|uniref:Uncharacterized protein n=1 Tax=Populus alba x Populus x berolinensis TaxID=444605 RepID=A0AAD6WG69_9ROSI|nr:hypothetical protein NC653_000030 [Populus alba x Populus x berolinensis]
MPLHGMYFPCHPRNFQDEVYGLTRQHQTAQDVEVIDDDIAIISPSMFAQARKKARRNTDAVRENIDIANQARSVLQFHGLSQPAPPPQLPGLCQTMPPPQFPGFSQTVPPAQVSGLSQAVPPPAAPAFRCHDLYG